MMINIAICDDERIFLEQLEKTIRFVAKELRLVVIVTQYSHGLELLKHQKKHQLFFLDIDMPDVTGFYISEKLMKNEQAKVVLVTNHRSKVFDAFKYNVFRFIPKPIEAQKISEVLTSYDAELEKAFVLVYNAFLNARFRLKYEDIEYVEAFDKKVSISAKNELYEHRGNMKWWLNELDLSLAFYQVHRSYIVNFAKVKRVDASYCHMSNGQKVPIAIRKRKKVIAQFEAYIMRKMSE